MKQRHPIQSAQRQRGVIGVIGALVIGLVLALTIAVVDGGRLWFAKRQLQQIADVAAMSAANRIGCDGTNTIEILAAAQAAAVANGFQGNLANLPNLVSLGVVNTNGHGIRIFSQAATGTEAVKVVVTQSLPTSLIAPMLYADATEMKASAVAVANLPTAAYSVGSKTVNLSNSGLANQLLSALLGSPVALTVAGFEGLAKASLSVRDLINVGLLVGSVEEALDATIEVRHLLQASVNAINLNHTADINASLAGTQILNALVPDVGIKLGDILVLNTATGDAALDARINVLDLINASLMLANKEHFVELNVGVPGVLGVGLTVIEPPQLAVGFAGTRADGSYCTEARTAQIRLRVPITLLNSDLALNVEVGRAVAGLKAIDVGSSQTDVTIAASSGLAKVSISNIAGTGDGVLKLLVPIATIGADLDLTSQPTDLNFPVPHPLGDESLNDEQEVVSSLGQSLTNALAQPGALRVTLLGLNLNGLLDTVLGLLASILGPVLTSVVDPLLDLLGVQIGVGTVVLRGVEGGNTGLLVI